MTKEVKLRVFCKYSKRKKVKKHLESEIDLDINAVDSCNRSALHYACREGDKYIISLLLKQKNIDLSLQDSKGMIPLHYAILYHEDTNKGKDIIIDLIKAGSYINEKTYNSLKINFGYDAELINSIFSEDRIVSNCNQINLISARDIQIAKSRSLPKNCIDKLLTAVNGLEHLYNSEEKELLVNEKSYVTKPIAQRLIDTSIRSFKSKDIGYDKNISKIISNFL